ncbi:hypothetical protein L210DRAFT_3765866 [Boletus edulis BED1]|uniref:Uncharacterized protein n=1 Tax=Boletus edulis BED1 TaxID=1328754 RepID=A0AAD4G7X1_BOLED|nr:hypothetical protein L210DRAFT_3765866 [Boletus edulis BED1]
MSGPDNGKYLIKLASDGRPLGCSSDPKEPLQDIVTNGVVKVFNVIWWFGHTHVMKLERDGLGRFVEDQDGRVVGSLREVDRPWKFTGPPGGPYTIELDDSSRPNRMWTVKNSSSVSAVTLEPPGDPSKQQFTFTSWPTLE